MPTPITHHHALGIHPGAFVQPTAPTTADVQDGVLWLDTSAGPPYVLRRWDQSASAWRVVQMDQTGYPLPGGYRLEVSNSISVSNDNQDSGVIVVADDTTETVIAGLDLSLADAVGPITISWHLTASFTHPPESTTVIFRLRRTDASGAILAFESAGYAPSVQDTSGNSIPWQDTFIDTAPSDKHYVITALNLNDPGVVFYSLTHIFKLESDGPTERVQLVGADGTVWWQHDGTNSTVLSDGRAVLDLPLPVLADAPRIIAGKDPATGLLAFGPLAAVTTDIPVAPAPVTPNPPGPGPADNCTQVRCGAAIALRDQLEQTYDQWSQWINFAAKTAIGLSITAAIASLAELLAVIEVAAWILQIFGLVRPFLSGVSLAALPSLAPRLDSPQLDHMLESIFCKLSCEGGAVPVDAGVLAAWSADIAANPSWFINGFQVQLLGWILQYRPLQEWQSAAATGGNNPSTFCDGFSCP